MKTIQEMLQELSQCIVTVSGEFRFRTNWNGGKVPQPDLDVFDPNVPFCIENVGDVPVEIGLYNKGKSAVRSNCKISTNLKTWSDYNLVLTDDDTSNDIGRILLQNKGDRVYIKADRTPFGSSPPYPYPHTRFKVFNLSESKKIRARGNIASLNHGSNDLYKTDYLTYNPVKDSYYYYAMFSGCTSLTQAPELPATTLADYCYNLMFSGCTSLTQAPELPATTLAYYCYDSMFRGCTSLTQAPELPATTLADYCYYSMFKDCTSLVHAPELPATTLADHCYNSMFKGCTSLTQAPELPATTLADYCYNSMFKGCTSLTQAPVLPATKLYYMNCYDSMFFGCTSLTQAPELPATTLSSNCYNSMFKGCTSLTQAPVLPATKLCYMNCYNSMFYGCTSLVQAPELPATTLSSNCYNSMFYGCTSLVHAPELPAIMVGDGSYKNMFKYCSKLNYIKVLATFDSYTEDSFTDWLFGTANEGELCCYTDSEYLHRFGQPGGWRMTYIDPPQADHPDLDIFNPDVPFCVENTGINPAVLNLMFDGWATTIVNHIAISYDNKRWGGWTDWYNKKKPYTLKLKTKGDRVYIKAAYNSDYSSYVQLSTVNNDNIETFIRVRGNINSVIHGDTDSYKTEYTTLSSSCYRRLFSGCTSLTQAPELPATKLASNCYSEMFWNCTSLTQAPELPATTLASNCYDSMFRGCTSLTQAPELPATTLANYCYYSMFKDCTSLVHAPELPATTLADHCYNSMFKGCTSLTQAPELPATMLVFNCYSSMFSSCTKLNYVKCLATNKSAEYYTNDWLSNVSATGDFYTPAATTWTSGMSGIPSGWTRHNV